MIQWKGCNLIIVLMTVAMFVQSSDTFQLQLSNRPQGSNAITLSCRNSTGILDPRAVFFLNNSELNPATYPGFSDQSRQRGMVAFQINRQLEGMYSCGIGEVRSSNISLIAYPTSDTSIRRNRNTYFAIAGKTAVLNCAVSPGALIHYYYVTWRNGSRTLFRQSLPSLRNSTYPDSTDPRYRLDPMNLSLIIDDVRRSDSIQDYHCDLEVADPRTGSTYSYGVAASNVNIALTVLSPPIITATPEEDTVSQGENAIFRCTAEGYPLPTISWMHNGRRIVTDSHRDYLVTPKNNGSTMVISYLRIFSVSADRTGEIICIASANSPVDSGITLDNDTANTSLTVLGMFKKVDVLISTGGDVIFSIELPIVYSQSIHLFLNYTNDHNPTESYNRTTKIGFLNTNTVQYLEHSSFVHYDRFRVKAGLMSGQDVLGPLTTAPGAYDKTQTTFCESGFDPRFSIMFCVLAVLFFILCIALVVAICIVTLIKNRDLSNLAKSITKYVEEQQANSDADPTARDSPVKNDSSAPSENRVAPDGTDTQPGDHLNGEMEMKSSAHSDDTVPNSPTRLERSRIIKKYYRSSPVYGDVKVVLKGAKLPERKYKWLKKELKKECSQNP